MDYRKPLGAVTQARHAQATNAIEDFKKLPGPA